MFIKLTTMFARYFSAFVFSFLTITTALSAQTTSGGTTLQSAISAVGPSGQFVAGEAIVAFTNPLSVEEIKALNQTLALNYRGGQVLNISPSGKYGLLRVPGAQTCDLTGDGNTLGLPPGQGQELDLNYYMSPTGASSVPADDICGVELTGEKLREYNPLYNCGTRDQLIPTLGKNVVRVAIFDAGRDPAAPVTFPGVTTNQIDLLEINERPSNVYNPHGKYVHDIIAGLFYGQGIEDQLIIDEYRVMNEQLEATLFDVIMAFEMAMTSPTPPDIISMSIGFQPSTCSNSENVKEDRSLLHRIIQQAQTMGINVVVSAGNDSDDLAETPSYPAAEANLPNLITVGASACGVTNAATWSNTSDVFVHILAPGDGVKVLENDCYRSVYGTSFSTPLIAAKAAMHATQTFNSKETVEGVTDRSSFVRCLLFSEVTPAAGAVYGTVDANVEGGVCRASRNHYWKSSTSTDQHATVLGALSLSPNPCNDELQIRVATNDIPQGGYSVTIADVSGRVVLRDRYLGSNPRIDVSQLRSGAYWLNVTTAAETKTLKFIKR